MFSFQIFGNKLKQCSEEKINAYAIASWYGNTWKVILLMLFFSNFMMYFEISFENGWILLIYIIGMFLMLFYLFSRRAGIAITENRFVFAKLKPIGNKIGRTYEIPVDKIKMITVRKFLSLKTVKMSFISDVGKLEKINFMFSSFVIGVNLDEYRKNSLKIYNRLKEVEKVVDKGDF